MDSIDEFFRRRVMADQAYQRGRMALEPSRALAAFTRAVHLSPDIPDHRLSFARLISRCDPVSLSRRPVSRVLRRGGVLDALAIVLAAGGQAAAAAEAFACAFILEGGSIRSALTFVSAGPPSRLDAALGARPLRSGAGARLLHALLGGVLIRDPTFLEILDGARQNIAVTILSNPAYVPTEAARAFIDRLKLQIWLQDGILIRPPDPSFMASLMRADPKPAALDCARALFPLVVAPGILPYESNIVGK